jgi:hypothetical protein
MQVKYVPLYLWLIDQGRFVAQAADEFAKLQNGLIAYKTKHGEASVGAKAKFTLEVTLGIEHPAADDQISIVAQIKRSMPATPASTSKATAAKTDKGEGALFVRASGSSTSPPQQAVLCTDDGKTVDQKTRKADKKK